MGAVMSSYNITNGLYMSANPYLIDTVLKRQWGFDGVFMSDWGATHDGVAAANARPRSRDADRPVHEPRDSLGPAIRDGKVSAGDDRRQGETHSRSRRALRLAGRTGAGSLDLALQPGGPQGRARTARSSGAVLLKNDNALLPLDARRVKNIAVIGPLAYPACANRGRQRPRAAVHVGERSRRHQQQAGRRRHRHLRARRAYAARAEPADAVQNGGRQRRARHPRGDLRRRHRSPARRRPRASSASSRRGSPGFGGDPDFFTLLDQLPPEQGRALMGSLTAHTAEAWLRAMDGLVHADLGRQPHARSCRDSAAYRLLVDDKLVIDSSRIAEGGAPAGAGDARCEAAQGGVRAVDVRTTFGAALLARGARA